MTENSAASFSSSIDHWQPSRVSTLAHSLMLLGAALAIVLVGTADDGSVAAFLIALASALLFCRPQISVDRKICAAAIALICAASLALLPHGWFGAAKWRDDLSANGVRFPATISPTPVETIYWIAILGILTCAVLFALAHPIRSKTQFALALAAVTFCGAYASLAIYANQAGWEFAFANNPQEFGFFPNRNHTSTFLATGSVAALGILVVAFRDRRWLAGTLASISLVVCVTGLIFFSRSRGGIVALFGGTLLWLIGLGPTHLSRRLLISFSAVFLGGIALFLCSPGVVRDRWLNLSGAVKDRIVSPELDAANANGAPLDGRVPIFLDTLKMIRDFPITGIGLGNFRYVFPLYRERSAWEAPVLHPEGDWAMLAAEAGIPAVLAIAGGIALLVRAVWPLRDHPNWPVRWALLCAAFAAMLHGAFDVPAHRVALGSWILVLACIGFQNVPRKFEPRSRAQNGAFFFAGLAAIALSIFLVRAQWLDGRASPPFSAYEAQVEIMKLRFEGGTQQSVEAAQRAIEKFPLADFLHFQLGVSLLQLGHDAEADAAFRTQRLINPIPTAIPIEQGNAWLDSHPEKVGALWLDAVRRQARMAPPWNNPLGLFRDLLNRAHDFPVVENGLRNACMIAPDFAFAWLDQASPNAVETAFPQLADNRDFTATLSERDRSRFLQSWYRSGNRDALFSWLASQPDWKKSSRAVELRRLVDAGKPSQAIETAEAQFGFKLDLPEPGEAMRNPAESAPDDPLAAFAYYWRVGNVVTARRILEDARAKNSRIDPEILRLDAAVNAHDGNWPVAWQHVERYLHETAPDAFP